MLPQSVSPHPRLYKRSEQGLVAKAGHNNIGRTWLQEACLLTIKITTLIRVYNGKEMNRQSVKRAKFSLSRLLANMQYICYNSI